MEEQERLHDGHKKFVELVTEVNKKEGMRSLPSKLLGELFIEPYDISLKELSERTGYSISAVSEAMKTLCESGLVKRKKKPGSRKVYFYMEKDVTRLIIKSLKGLYRQIFERMADTLPEIIEMYGEPDVERYKKEKEILGNYRDELDVLWEDFDKFVKILKKRKEEF